MNKLKMRSASSLLLLSFFFIPFFLPTPAHAAIVQCGTKAIPRMCELCDMIIGLNNVIQYGLKIAIGFSLLMLTVGGIMYMMSSGSTGMTDNAKGVMKNAVIGFIVMFSAWLMVNYSMIILGTKQSAGIALTEAGNPWGGFKCSSDGGANANQNNSIQTPTPTTP